MALVEKVKHTRIKMKCKDTKCDRVGYYKNGFCYFCRRKNLFYSGYMKLNTGEEYSYLTSHNMRNYKACRYPNCSELISNGSTTNYCIEHRIKVKVK